MRAGITHPDAVIGCYANQHFDHEELSDFWDGVVVDYHGSGQVMKPHVVDPLAWGLDGVAGLIGTDRSPIVGLKTSTIGHAVIPVRLRVSRNFSEFDLPASMKKEGRISLECMMCDRFATLAGDPEFAGKYYSLTPGHGDQVSEDQYIALVNEQLMFRPMSQKRLLISSGIAEHWPIGRGAFISTNKRYCVWVGEEDHIRITVQVHATDLAVPFNNLKRLLDAFENPQQYSYAVSSRYGYVTSSPDRLGTTLFFTLQICLPGFTLHQAKKAKAVLHMIGFALGTTRKAHVYEISLVRRLGLTERRVVQNIWTGLRAINKIANKPDKP
jgi:creatine kinase